MSLSISGLYTINPAHTCQQYNIATRDFECHNCSIILLPVILSAVIVLSGRVGTPGVSAKYGVCIPCSLVRSRSYVVSDLVGLRLGSLSLERRNVGNESIDDSARSVHIFVLIQRPFIKTRFVC